MREERPAVTHLGSVRPATGEENKRLAAAEELHRVSTESQLSF